jgi:hypothetical protein
MLETYTDRETLVVFAGGRDALAFCALHVARLTASELWLGREPLPLGTLLGVGASLFDPRTRVLELETTDGDAVPILARGSMRLRTVCPRSLHSFIKPPTMDDGIAACVRGVVVGEPGRIYDVGRGLAGLPELIRRHSTLPPARNP